MTWPNGVVVQKSSIRKFPNVPLFGEKLSEWEKQQSYCQNWKEAK